MSDEKKYSKELKAIWDALNDLRSEPIAPKDYVVILFFLGLIKARIINAQDNIIQGRLELWVESLIQKNGKARESMFLDVLQIFDPIIRQLTKPGAQRLLDNLIPAIDNLDSTEFKEIFDEVLYRVLQAQGRHGDEVVQPIEITRLISALAELPEDAKVFNPFAGLASFGVFLNETHQYYGQELNARTWAIGMLRLHAHERMNNSTFQNVDSLDNWPDDQQRFDLVVSNPPFRMKVKSSIKQHADVRTVEQFVIKAGLDLLKPEGKLIVLVPLSFLTAGGAEGRLRKQLIEGDILDTVVELPGQLMKNTVIPVSVMVLAHKKKNPGIFRLVDGRGFKSTNAKGEQILKAQELLVALHKRDEDNLVVRWVGHEDIEKEKYNLAVKRYFTPDVEGTPLEEFLRPISGTQEDISSDQLFIRISDLKEDLMDYVLTAPQLSSDRRQPKKGLKIEQSCLLVAMRGAKLKPTYFEYTGTPVFTDHRISAFTFDKTSLDPGYLVNELNQHYVLDQVAVYQSTISIPSIKLQDLLNIRIRITSLSEQLSTVKWYKDLARQIIELTQERDALASGNVRSARVEFGSLKHTLGRPRQNILSWSENLLNFIEKHKQEFEELNRKFAEEYFGRRIDQVFNEIKTDVNFITTVLEKGDHGLILEKHKKRFVSLEDFNASIKSQCGISRENFVVNFRPAKSEDLKTQGIVTNTELLTVLFDNILSNADKYAFSKFKEGNEVVVELTASEEKLVVEVKNNGLPFPRNFDREKFITKYATSDNKRGTGLGGYDVDRIATYLGNPNWQLVLNEDSVYPVIFKFEFPVEYMSDN